MWKETVFLRGLYDFDYALQRLAMDPLNKVDRNERFVDVPFIYNNVKHIVRVRAIGDTSNPCFEISGDNVEDKEQVMRQLNEIFQWDDNLERVTAHFNKSNLAHLFDSLPGTPIVRDFQLYASLMKIIIHQQLNMKFAHTLTTRFVEKYGECHDGVWFYPDPETVASISYSSLRELQFSQRKAEYVIDTSRLIASSDLDLESLSVKSDEEIMNRLTKVRGIGNWTAQNWLLFGLGRKDLFPMADIGVKNALKQYFNKDTKPEIEEMEKWSDSWAPYRSYATLTLWRSIE